MSNDKSRPINPIYPFDSFNYSGDFRNDVPMDYSAWEGVTEADIEAAKAKSRQSYNMELGNEIAFDDLNEDIKRESQVDFDVIIDNVDIDDYGNNYENDYGSYNSRKRLY